MSFSSMMIRYYFGKNDRQRDKGLTIPVDIEYIRNIPYGRRGKANLLDIARPKNQQGDLPVIVSFHGGAWVYGSKELYQFYCADLAARGFVTVNFNYRLAPEHKYPAPLEDVNQVMEWLFIHGREYHMDLSRIYMVGDSAGAHMLTLYSCICTNPEYAKEYSFTVPNHFVPSAVGLNCGVYDIYLASGENGGQAASTMRDFLGRKNQEQLLKKVNAIEYVTEDFPRTYLMSATGDFLLTQLPPMEQKLKEKNITYVSRVYGDDINQLGHVFHCTMGSKDAAECNQAECDFFLQK